MKDGRKPYKIKLQVTYTLSINVSAFDDDEAVDELEKWIKQSDDYELVNRSSNKSFNIEEVKQDWDRVNEQRKKNNEQRAASAKIKKL